MADSLELHRGVPPRNDGFSAVRVVFPSSVEDFERDPRISFSKLDSKWILEDDDGSEWEFDESLKRWIPSVRPAPAFINSLELFRQPSSWQASDRTCGSLLRDGNSNI